MRGGEVFSPSMRGNFAIEQLFNISRLMGYSVAHGREGYVEKPDTGNDASLNTYLRRVAENV